MHCWVDFDGIFDGCSLSGGGLNGGAKNNQEVGGTHMLLHEKNIRVFFGQNKGGLCMDIFVQCVDGGA